MAASNRSPVALTIGVSASLSVVILVGGLMYHRWYFQRRKVETANFTFVSQRGRQLLSRVRINAAFIIVVIII